MAWWNQYPGINPIFTFDATSPAGAGVGMAHNHKIISNINQGAGRVFPSSILSNLGGSIEGYQTLRFNKSELQLSPAIKIPREFTMILKVKLYTSSTFLSNNGSNYGLIYGTGASEASDGLWRMYGYTSPQGNRNLQQRLKEDLPNIFDVVLKGNAVTKSCTLSINGTTHVIPPSSGLFDNFLKPDYSFATIGDSYGNTTWVPNADVIAYGLFDSEMSEEQLEQVFLNIDLQFKKTSVDRASKVFNILPIEPRKYKNTYGDYTTQLIEILKEKPITDYNKKFLYSLNILKGGTVYNVLYKNVHDIVDQVLEEGVPVAVKLYLYHKATGQLVKTTISSNSGWFSFYDLDEEQEYIVSASDNKKQFKSIIKDYDK